MKLGQNSRTESPPEEAYCAASTDVLPAGGEESWVSDPVRRRLLRVPHHLAALLSHLSRFRTLPEHRAALRQAGWQDDGSGFLDASFRELIQSGLLCSRSDFLARLRRVDGSCDSPPGITSAGWVTCNRRSLLQESLRSFVASFLAAGRRIELKVFDDSRDPADREATRGMLAALSRETGLAAHYCGAEEKRAFAADLVHSVAKEGIRPELVEFALFDPHGFRYTVGANLNAFLLGTQGELSLKLDDDTFCRFATPLHPEEGLALNAEPDPTSSRPFPDSASREQGVAQREADILQAHERLLGRSVAECLRMQEPAGTVRCDGVETEFLQLLEIRSAWVAATMAGICGDSGMSSSRYLLSLLGPERERLVESEQGYRSCLQSRQILRVASGFTVSPRDVLMSMNSGFDNRELLPPFLPGLYNSDGLFAVTLRSCWPEGLIGHLPLAGEHRPPEARRFQEGECRTFPLRLADLLILLVHSLPPRPSSREAQLAALGRYLVELASAEPADFEALARRLRAADMSAYTLHLERLLTYYQEEQDKSYIRNAFSHYLSNDVVNELLTDRDKLNLGGEKKVLTALFTDIRGFSTLSETMDPRDLVKLLNLYLTDMSRIIIDLRGTVDKYEGDAIISFFGAPQTYEDHAVRACTAAVRMKRMEHHLNEHFLAEKLSPSPLYTRIGINTGEMVVGNMGSELKMDYTIMGSSVNLASRLETVNKQYGTWILASEVTRRETGEAFAWRELDPVVPAGFKKPVRLYELLEEPSALDVATREAVELFHQGKALYENRQWDQATQLFQQVLGLLPGDGPAGVFMKRCREYQEKPPGASFPVFSLTVK